MWAAVEHSISNVIVLVIIASLGYWVARRGIADAAGRKLVSRLVNLSIPFFLFYSVTSKFTHDQLIELLKMGFLPFLVVALNFLASQAMIRLGWVRRELAGAFTACFTGSTVLFVGVPMAMALFGEAGIPYLLVYFFANCVFIWTVGLYNIQLDGVRRVGGERPALISARSLRMLLSLPLVSFLAGLAFVLFSLPVPDFLSGATKLCGQMTTPLAIVFIGMTIEKVGFERMKHLPREIWLVLLGCFVIRPVLMYVCTLPFDMEPLMQKVFVVASALPVSSVIAVLAKQYGADEEYTSEAIGASTIALIAWLPVILIAVTLI